MQPIPQRRENENQPLNVRKGSDTLHTRSTPSQTCSPPGGNSVGIAVKHSSEQQHLRDTRLLIRLMDQERHEEALPVANRLMHALPDVPELLITASTCLAECGEIKQAVKLLRKGVKRFTGNRKVQSLLGVLLARAGNVAEGEERLRALIELIPPEEAAERADAYVTLGETLWEAHHRQEALDAWTEAVRIDPNHRDAKRLLNEFTNVYGEPKAPSRDFDDFYHFLNIQTQKYNSIMGRSEYQSMQEAERVVSLIRRVWNEQITPQIRDIDAMSAQERSAHFRSILIDFTGPNSKKP